MSSQCSKITQAYNLCNKQPVEILPCSQLLVSLCPVEAHETQITHFSTSTNILEAEITKGHREMT